MTQPQLFFRSLMVQGPEDTLSRLAKAFGVAEGYVLEQDVEDAPDYLTHHLPALFYQRTNGDFSYFIEPMLWDISEADFVAKLKALSAKDLAIALPDETTDSPFKYRLYFDSETLDVEIDEDEVFDENFVISNAPLRKKLREISKR